MRETIDPMFEHRRERRRYIRARADLEFELARITLALSRAPLARQAELLAWFDEAAAGLLARATPENHDYVEERVASIRETFFGDRPAAIGARGRAPSRAAPRMH